MQTEEKNKRVNFPSKWKNTNVLEDFFLCIRWKKSVLVRERFSSSPKKGRKVDGNDFRHLEFSLLGGFAI
jgi:hypothetical protein